MLRPAVHRILAFVVALGVASTVAVAVAADTPTVVTLVGTALTIEGSGAIADGTTLRITAGGRYRLRGVLDGGEIVVDAGEADVEIVLDGARVTSVRSAALHVVSAGTTTLTLAPGSENLLADAREYVRDDPDSVEPGAAVYARDDLVVRGSGSLTVVGAYHNGIQGNDDVRIVEGTITVEAVNHGIKGRDSLVIEGGVLRVRAGSDGLQSSNADDPELGFVRIEGGTLDIVAGDDGIQAETHVVVGGGTVSIVAGGGHLAPPGTAKGVKGLVEVRIEGGTLVVDAADDAIHTHGALVVRGGKLTLSAGDDAMHSDGTLEIHGGDIDVTASYEGLEAASIVIFDGTIRVVARDDGINAVSGPSPTAGARGPARMPAGGFGAPGGGMGGGDAWLRIHGGTIVVFAAGSAGMAQAPGAANSTQPTLAIGFASTVAAGTPVRLETEAGVEVVTFVAAKPFASLVVSSPDLRVGDTVVVLGGGDPTRAPGVDGRIVDGELVGASEVARVSLTDAVTYLGSRPGAAPRR